jgi:hypothetical protein
MTTFQMPNWRLDYADDGDRDGVVVLRNVLNPELWSHVPLERKSIDRFNPVASDYPSSLPHLCVEKNLIDIAVQFIGFNIGIYHQRLLIKDKHACGAVPLHQDAPYHRGFWNKVVCFVALSECTEANGKLVFYKGSNKLGSLGDVGEVARHVAEPFERYSPDLSPGDIVLMNPFLLHESGPRQPDAPDRVMADIIYQDAYDPSTIEVVRGEGGTLRSPADPFVSSRSMKIRELQKRIDDKERCERMCGDRCMDVCRP